MSSCKRKYDDERRGQNYLGVLIAGMDERGKRGERGAGSPHDECICVGCE